MNWDLKGLLTWGSFQVAAHWVSIDKQCWTMPEEKVKLIFVEFKISVSFNWEGTRTKHLTGKMKEVAAQVKITLMYMWCSYSLDFSLRIWEYLGLSFLWGLFSVNKP